MKKGKKFLVGLICTLLIISNCIVSLAAPVSNGSVTLPENSIPVPTVMDIDFEGGNTGDRSVTGVKLAKTVGTPQLSGGSADFNRNSAYLYGMNQDIYGLMSTEKGMTAEIYFKWDTTGSNDFIFANRVANAGFNFGAVGDTLYFFCNVSGNWQWVNTKIPVGEWIHVVGTFDGTKVSLYINGELKGSSNRSGRMNFPSAKDAQYIALGGNCSGNNDAEANSFSDVTMKYARLYGQALSNEQIKGLNANAETPVRFNLGNLFDRFIVGNKFNPMKDVTSSGDKLSVSIYDEKGNSVPLVSNEFNPEKGKVYTFIYTAEKNEKTYTYVYSSAAFDPKSDMENLIRKAEQCDTTGVNQEIVQELNDAIDKAKQAYESGVVDDQYLQAYNNLEEALKKVKNNTPERSYAVNYASRLILSFGWEGDKHAPFAYIDGGYTLRDNNDVKINFGVWNIPGKIKWYNKEGYLPCFVSEFEKDELSHVIENFADLVVIDGNKYEIAYSRMTTTNNSDKEMKLPNVSEELIPLNDNAENAVMVKAGETIVRDYAIGADRFGGTYDYPSVEVIKAQGTWDDHYTHMKDYWNKRLEPIANITKLPDERLINAYKAGYIYTLIIKDDDELNVGECWYDSVFDHDVIGIIATLVTMGDYTDFKNYVTHILDNVQYPDARWKYSWPYALYLEKSGDEEFIIEMFETIKTNTHAIETDRTGKDGIMKNTDAIDSNGSWLIDNWSALMGLTSYGYICDELYTSTNDAKYKSESEWAKNQYDSLLAATEKVQKEMRDTNNYPYLSIDMNVTTENSARGDVRDGNWASMFLFGRWAWDGYLFGADQTGSDMISLIDDTYTHGFDRRKDVSDSIYNFGGYPHGYYSSAYNAGYGSTALRGEMYRDAGIKAYQFMIDKTMSGPFGWWEGIGPAAQNWNIGYTSDKSPWDIDHADQGQGSCQHMWGQSVATKVLFDSLIAAKSDGTAIVGRGIPAEWITEGEEIEVLNYPVSGNKRIGVNIKSDGKKVTLTVTGDNSDTPISLELIALKNNIKSVSDNLEFDAEKGTVSVPAGVKTVVVNTNAVEDVDKEALQKLVDESEELDKEEYTQDTWAAFSDALKKAKEVLADEDATQEEVDNAEKVLDAALKGLAENEQFVPKIIKGANQKVEQGKEASFTSNTEYKDFESVEVDGKVIDKKNYTVKEGSTIVTLNGDYTKTLKVGKHTFAINSEAGKASTNFTVVSAAAADDDAEQEGVNTGDSNMFGMWIALLIITTMAMAYGLYRIRKEK